MNYLNLKKIVFEIIYTFCRHLSNFEKPNRVWPKGSQTHPQYEFEPPGAKKSYVFSLIFMWVGGFFSSTYRILSQAHNYCRTKV